MIPYKPIEQQFRETAQEIGNNRKNIPHLVIGKGGIQTNNQNMQNYPQNYCPYCKRPYNYTNMPPNTNFKPQNRPEDKDYKDTFTKIRNWGLWIAISIVIGYAVYRLLWGFIF